MGSINYSSATNHPSAETCLGDTGEKKTRASKLCVGCLQKEIRGEVCVVSYKVLITEKKPHLFMLYFDVLKGSILSIRYLLKLG